MHKLSAVFNHDSGTNWAHALRVAESQAEDFEAIVQPILDYMKVPQADHEGPVFELHTVPVMQPAGGGSDHASFAAVGVPAFGWRLKGEVRYGRGWHSQWDSWSIVVPEYQRHTATVIAVVAGGVANLDHLLSREGVERARPGSRGRVNAQLVVEAWLGVELDDTQIAKVGDDSVAAAAELTVGDRITAVGDQDIGDARELLAALRKARGASQRVMIKVVRNERAIDLTLQL